MFPAKCADVEVMGLGSYIRVGLGYWWSVLESPLSSVASQIRSS